MFNGFVFGALLHDNVHEQDDYEPIRKAHRDYMYLLSSLCMTEADEYSLDRQFKSHRIGIRFNGIQIQTM